MDWQSTQPASARPAAPATSTRQTLDGALLSPAALLLIACGTLGGLLFAAIYLVEGATRPGYDTLRFAISALSLGSGGWVQQVNFVVFGILALASAVGWRMALAPGAGATWYPLLKGITGVGLIVDGFFSQDAIIGFPVGTTALPPASTHAVVHNLAAIVTVTCIAISDFVLARRFAQEPRWHGWVLYTATTGLLTIVFIAIFGAINGHVGTPAGLFERVATGINTFLSVAIFTRLLLDRRAIARS